MTTFALKRRPAADRVATRGSGDGAWAWAEAAGASRPVAFKSGVRLALADATASQVLLIEDGIVALRSTASDGAADVGLVGPGGVVGVGALLSGGASPRDALALSPVRARYADGAALVRAAANLPAVRAALDRIILGQLRQATQIAVCNARHSVEQRVARWLLQAADLRGDRPIDVTHQRLADALGVRRAGVTVALHVLEGDHGVRCRRGGVEIRDAARIGLRSCGCERLMRPPWGEAPQALLSSASSMVSPRD